MKVYISVDAEGISGITKVSQVTHTNPEYAFCRKMMVEDVNAAIRGAFNAGATSVIVNDSHSIQTNIQIDQLDPRVELISGFDKHFMMMEGIEYGFDAAILVGYHTRAGDIGVISHTYYYSKIIDVKINNKPVAEYELNGMLAGYFNTPVVFISGDDKLTADVKRNYPDIYTTTTKKALGHTSALCYHPVTTHKSIEENVEKALRNFKTDIIKPMFLGTDKIDLQIQFADYSSATYASYIPGVNRIGTTTVGFTGNNYLDVFKAFVASIIIASAYDPKML